MIENSLIASGRRYLAETITDVDYADDLEILANTLAQPKYLLHSQDHAARGIGFYMNSIKIASSCLKYMNYLHIKWQTTEINRLVYISQ